MSVNKVLKLRNYKYIFAILLTMGMTNTDKVYAFTADEVVNKMTERERSTYLAGIVDGFTQARWVKDKPDQSGMKCIFNWYYKGGNSTQANIEKWFSRHLTKEANGLLYVLVKRECGT